MTTIESNSQPLPTSGCAPFFKSITESSLRKLDSVLYKGRKITLIVSCLLPVISLISTTVSTVAIGIFCGIGLLAYMTFTLLEDSERKKTAIDKSIRSLIVMNVCNKIAVHCFPILLGLMLANEIATVSPVIVGVNFGIASAVLMSAFFYVSGVFERDYINQKVESIKEEIVH